MEEIKILLIEDDEEDFFITNEIISEIKNQKYTVTGISTYENALNEMKKDIYDIFLVDYKLGAKTGLDLIDEVIEINRNIPIILLTGEDDHKIDILAMKKGASDFLVKGKMDADRLERSIRYAIEKKKTDNKILYLAYYDQVTDLPNRIFFMEQLNYALAHAIRYKRTLAVLYLDLDNFKLINDSLGHDIGDVLLKKVAQRLCSTIRKSDIIARNSLKTPIDTIARLGGDEFTLSLTEINNYEDASLVANRIINTFNEPFIIENNKIFSSVSIGIALYPEDSNHADTLLKYADNAMYHAKKQGKNNFQYYQEFMKMNVLNKVYMINNIRTAINKNDFILYYQPKMDLKSGKIIGFEELIRWNQGEKGIISPINFIPFAEEHHLISYITDWVIHEVCKKFYEWKKAKLNSLPISINIPINQFKKPDFVKYFIDIIESNHISPNFFELEVTESIFMDDLDITISKLNELQSKGFKISIDDFGYGFSSLHRLKQIPCNILKIDRSFIKSINENVSDNIIINSIIMMGHGLNMDVLAEGVETAAQFNFIKQNNCDFFQGFLLSPPLPEEKIPEILKKEAEGNGIGIQLIKKINEDLFIK